MKKLYLLLIYSFLLMSALQLSASHVIGGYISYKYIAPLTYKVSQTFFLDCANGSVPPFSLTNVCVSSQSCGQANTYDLNLESINNRSDNPCSPTVLSTCAGGFSLGIMEAVYSDTIVLPIACSDWIIGAEICCAYASIINLTNAAGAGVYMFATLDNLNYPVNSSPDYNQIIFNQYCVGNFTAVNLSCNDLDGDSISYELSPSHDASGFCAYTATNLQYNSGYTFSQPFMSSTPQFIDPVNGIYYLTPANIETGRLALTLKEYRNGILMDSITREDMLIFKNFVQNPDSIEGKVFHDLNNDGIQNGSEPSIENRIVQTDSPHVYAITDSNGYYLLRLPVGSYNVSVPNLSSFINCNPASHAVTFLGPAIKSSNNNFGLTYNPGIKDLRISVTSISQPISGFIDNIQIDYANVGTDTIFNPFVKLTLDSNVSVYFSNPNYDSISGNELFWNKNFLSPGQQKKIIFYFEVASTLISGTNLSFSAQIFPVSTDTFPSDNLNVLNLAVVGMPYDPNYKLAIPAGDISPQFINDSLYLNYTVHFQNTGTGAAINVVVKDTLDNNLDPGTFELLSSSHSCYPVIHSYGYYKTIDFVFNGINLPDSGNNFIASNGFVNYRIKPKGSLQVGDSIKNSAYIFFDFNSPVPTNTTVTSVVAPNGIESDYTNPTEIFVYPNPAADMVFIRLKSVKNTRYQVQILNLLGKELFKTNFISKNNIYEYQCNLKSLANGIYLVAVKTDQQVFIQKIIKQ